MTTTVASPPAPFPPPAVRAAVTRAMAAANDRPDPISDADRTPQKNAALSQEFRDSAWQHLDAGDLPQASNKAWALVAETVKDIAAQHGAIIHHHRTIAEVVTQLTRLVFNSGDTATASWIGAIFLTASKLHSNFYENELGENIILAGLMQCEELSALLYQLFGAPAPTV